MTTVTTASGISKMSGGFYSSPLLAFRGLAALLFVGAALIDFKATFTLLVWFFSVYVLFDGVYALRVAMRGSGGSSLTRFAIATKGLVGILAGVIAIYLFLANQSNALLLATVFVWVAIAGVMEGVWVIRNVKNKEIVLIIGSGAYLALAVALQFMFALAPKAGASVYNWIIIGFSAAFGIGMLIMSWAMSRAKIY